MKYDSFKSELESNQASVSNSSKHLNKGSMLNESARVKVAIRQIQIV